MNKNKDKKVLDKAQQGQVDLLTVFNKLINTKSDKSWVKVHFHRFLKPLIFKANKKLSMQ